MRYYLVDLERTIINKRPIYWNVNQRGYTEDKDSAGTFIFENALALCQNDIDYKTLMLPSESVFDKYEKQR